MEAFSLSCYAVSEPATEQRRTQLQGGFARGHFMGDVLLGSTADRVAHHAHCPVMVVR